MGMISRTVLLLAWVLLFASGCALAQDIRTVDGRKHLVHTVKTGQTLYAISRHYAVPVEAITRANPGAAQGLSIGDTLLIPVEAQTRKELKTAPSLAGDELAHTVAKRETLFGIARKYGISETDLLGRNPAARGGLQVGMVLFIPVTKVAGVPPVQTEPAGDHKGTQHLVMPGETLFALAQRYGVPVEAISAANDGLEQGLKAGTYVRIPAKVAEPEPAPVPPAPERPVGGLARVAMLLPFNLARNDSTVARGNGTKGMYPATDAAVQFYAGALIALDSLKEQGLNVDLSVFEVDDEPEGWRKVQGDPGLQNADLCIGPFYRAAIEQFASKFANTHFVCPAPLSNKVLLGHPNVSKVQSGRPDQIQQIARYVAAMHADDNIILCSPDNTTDKELRIQVRRILNEALEARPMRLRDSVVVVHGGKSLTADVIAKLSSTQQNVVVATSEDIEFVTGLVRELVHQAKEKRIVLVGLNAWMGMETLEARELEVLKTCVPASSWVDHGDPAVRRFTLAYRERWNNEPQEWAFLGFDATYFYVTALHRFGAAFPGHFDEVGTHPLHLSFRLRKTGEESGWRNETGTILRYEETGLNKVQ